MKKTLFLMAAATSVAVADIETTTTTYDKLLDSATGWNIQKGRNQGSSIVIADGDLTSANINWNQSSAAYTFENALTLSNGHPLHSLEFSFDIVTNGTHNTAMNFTLVSDTKTLTVGMGMYSAGNGIINYGTNTSVDARAFSFQNTTWDNGGSLVSSVGNIGSAPATGNTTVTGTIAYSSEQQQLVLTLTNGSNSATLNLGNSFNVNKIVFSVDGPNDASGAGASALTISHTVPEPATATLSLLALAGLAARRRRH